MLNSVEKHVLELAVGPAVHMDRAGSESVKERRQLFETLRDLEVRVDGVAVQLRRHMHRELADVILVDHRDPSLVLGGEVRHRGRWSGPIERPAPVREHDQRETAESQHAVNVGDHPERVGEMLEDVGADHEVLTLALDRR
jgi:hypothetical protein